MKPLISAISLGLCLAASAQDCPNILSFLVDDIGTQDTSVSFVDDQWELYDLKRDPYT